MSTAFGSQSYSGSIASTTSTSALLSNSLFSLTSTSTQQPKRILITGGGSGIGAYSAVGLALNGAKVYIVGRTENKLTATKQEWEKRSQEAKVNNSGEIVVLKGDISSKDGISKLVADYSKRETHLDVLINGAGILHESPLSKDDKDDASKVASTLFEEDWKSFSDVIDTNTISPYFTTLGFVPLLEKSSKPSLQDEGPVVLNITSIAAFHIARGLPASHSYQISKDAAEKTTKILAGRLIPYGIRVNSIAPGIFPSAMTGHDTPESFSQAAGSMVPKVKRSGTAEDMVGLLVFLSSRAGAYIDGATLVIDGGRTLSYLGA